KGTWVMAGDRVELDSRLCHGRAAHAGIQSLCWCVSRESKTCRGRLLARPFDGARELRTRVGPIDLSQEAENFSAALKQRGVEIRVGRVTPCAPWVHNRTAARKEPKFGFTSQVPLDSCPRL